MRRTPSQTVGPFYAIGLCRRDDSQLDPEGVELHGRLLDGQGQPIDDGLVELWDAQRRRWGRASTGADGVFRFRVPGDVEVLEAYVFARGLLRHQRTRIFFSDHAGLTDAERATLVARRDNGGLRFDIRMQGDDATVFFAQ